MAVFGILTVCTGNICRSPLAELLLRDRLQSIRDVELASAGTGARDGIAMPPEAAQIAVTLGVSPDEHRSQFVVNELIELSDLILTMARDHRGFIVKEVPRALRKTFTVREFARLTAGLTTEDIASMATGPDNPSRLRTFVAGVAARRGQVALPSREDLDDVVDPYGRSEATYQRSAEELLPAVEEVSRALIAASRAGQVAVI